MNTTDVTPWYRQFWPWFIIALPLTAVIACIITLVIAIKNDDPMVADNYYQEGQSINERIKQDQVATAQQMQANLLFAEQSQQINVYLTGNGRRPEALTLSISAPFDPQQDRSYRLTPVNDQLFSSPLKDSPSGRYYITLEPDHREWRLKSEINLPSEDTLVLSSHGTEQLIRQ